MSVTLDFNLLGLRVWALKLNLSEPNRSLEETLVDEGVNRTIKWFSRKWTSRLFR
jgi:hypothetical protein